MLKKITSTNDLENVVGGRLSVLTESNGIYVTVDRHAVIIPRKTYQKYTRLGYTEGQIVVTFMGRGMQFDNLNTFRATLHPNINHRIVDVNNNYIA